jgi:hypothetical protein
LHWTIARRRLRTFAEPNLRVVHIRQHISQIAHVEIGPADWAIAEIGLGFGDVIGIDADSTGS